MGLDVYLSYYKDFKQSKENEEVFEKFSNNMWESVKEVEGVVLSEKTKTSVWEVLKKEAAKYGLDDYGCDITYCERIELDSQLYPEHYFKIGYFRSSYNDSGINTILKDVGAPNLYDIFDHDDDEYEFSPDWNNSLYQVNEAIKIVKANKGYRVETISANMFSPDDVFTSSTSALAKFKKTLEDNKGAKKFTDFSNRDGNYYIGKKGLQVHALLPGKNIMGNPCTYAIYKAIDGDKYYLEALEIVKETIEYILKQDDPSKYYLRWSA